MQLEQTLRGGGTRRRRPYISLAALAFVLAVGCSGDSPTTPDDKLPPAPLEAAAPVATTTVLGAMQEIELSGLPVGRSDLQADVTAAGSGSAATPGSFQLPLFPTASGRYRLVIPLHPVAGVDGGSVDVRVRGGGGLVTAPLRLTLAPLPAAPGAFTASLDSLQSLLDSWMAREGLTRADVLAANARDVLPKRLLPIAIAQSLLDDPSHDRDLRDLLAGSTAFAPLVGTSQLDLDLVDRLVAAAGMPSFWNEMLDSASSAASALRAIDAAPVQDRVVIASAYDLHTAMRQASEARRAIDPSNPKAKVREDVGLALGAAGLFAGPAAGAVIAGISVMQFLTNTTLEAMAKTLPSAFVPNSMKFEVDIPRFYEDEPGPGSYRDVTVSASSEGMVLDKVILNAVLQVVGGTRAAGGLFQGQQGAKTVTDWVTDVGSFITETVAGKVPDADGTLRIPPETWSDIPLGSDLWTNARVTGTAIALGDEPTYLPVEAGEAQLTVETSLAHFGDAAPAFARKTIEVAPIQVELTASKTSVSPGEVVTIDIRVLDAFDTGLEWTLSSGSWVSGPTYLGSNLWRAEVQTPNAAGQFPVRATFTSTATGGARSTPGAPVRSATLRIFTGTILVEPYDVLLMPGESQTFTATVLGLENKAVTWSATGPGNAPASISSTGVFTAPTQLGEYLVIATSVEDPSLTGVANVTVGGACSWSLTIGGGLGGTWSGELAGHYYPPSAGGNFTMTFQRTAFDDYPIGTVWAVGGPGAGVTSGSWPANFSFTPSVESSIWVAVVAPGESSPPLLVSSNDGTTVVGSVSGSAVLMVDGSQSEPASFTFRFRSASNFACGPE